MDKAYRTQIVFDNRAFCKKSTKYMIGTPDYSSKKRVISNSSHVGCSRGASEGRKPALFTRLTSRSYHTSVFIIQNMIGHRPTLRGESLLRTVMDSTWKRCIHKKEITTERKYEQEFEETNDKDTGMECGAIQFRDLDLEKRRHKKARGIRIVDLQKNGENELDRTSKKRSFWEKLEKIEISCTHY